MSELNEISALITSAVRRVRMQRILDSLTYGFSGLFIVLLMLVLGFELGFIDADAFQFIYMSSIIIPVLAILVAGFRKVDPLPVTQRIDEQYGLKDRLSSAYSFGTAQKVTSFERAQIQDTARRLEGLSVKQVTPFRTPRGWKIPVLIFLLFTAAMVVRLPSLPSIESSNENRQQALQHREAVSSNNDVDGNATAALKE